MWHKNMKACECWSVSSNIINWSAPKPRFTRTRIQIHTTTTTTTTTPPPAAAAATTSTAIATDDIFELSHKIEELTNIYVHMIRKLTYA